MKWNDFGKNNQIGSSIKVYYSVFFSNQILIKYQFSLLRFVVVGWPFAPFFEEKKFCNNRRRERTNTQLSISLVKTTTKPTGFKVGQKVTCYNLGLLPPLGPSIDDVTHLGGEGVCQKVTLVHKPM